MSEARPADSRAARFMTWLAIVLALATDAVYLLLILGQDGRQDDVVTVAFVASYLAASAALLTASLARRWTAVVRLSLRAAAAGGLIVLGVLASFSIGLPLLIAGALATAAAARTMRGRLRSSLSISAVAAAAVAVVVLVAGFEVTERMIVCPAHGSSGGAGTGLVTGPYYYDCVNGRLTFHSGSCSSSSIDSNGSVNHPGC
jgi:hypothetical protein